MLDRPLRGVGTGGFQVIFNLRHNVTVLVRHIRSLAGVGLQIIEFQRFPGLRPNSLPIAPPDGLLKPSLMKLPIEKLMVVGLGLA